MSDDILRQSAGQPTGGQFRSHERAGAEATLSSPSHHLGEGAEWRNGGQAAGVTIVESPITDRERNYWIAFDLAGGHVNVEPAEFGIADPDQRTWDDRDRLYLAASSGGGEVELQYGAHVDEDLFQIDDFEDVELEEIEAEVVEALRGATGDETIDVEFSSGGGRWDDVSVLVNRRLAAEDVGREPDGRLSLYTSNVMGQLEDDAAYQAVVRDRLGDEIVSRVLVRHRQAAEV